MHDNPKMLEGRGGHYSIMFCMGRLPSGPIPLPFYTRFLTEKVPLLVYLLLAKWYPVHIPTIKDNQLGSHCSDTCLSLFQCSFVMVFSVELSKFEANIERDREKEVEHNISRIFLQLTQVLMSQIVVKNFATLCCIRKIHSLHKTYTRNLKKLPFRCRVVKSSWLLPKIATYMYSVSNGRLLCSAFLYRWRFLNNKSLDWPLTLTTQPSTSKLSDITLYRPSQ